MSLSSEQKKEIFGKYGKSNTDTGSAESQVALFSARIGYLTEHLKSNKKDNRTLPQDYQRAGYQKIMLFVFLR